MRARDITTVMLQSWLDGLKDDDGNELGASSKNHYRTIVNLAFNTAIRRALYDTNPCAGVPQFKEPAGRDVLVTPDKFRDLLMELEDDTELWTAVLVLAVLNLRKNELLARRWVEVELAPSPEGASWLFVPTTKNDKPKKIPLPWSVVECLKELPSHGTHEYLFPSRPTARHPVPKRPYRWDIGKQFRDAARALGLNGLRVHDLKHVAPSLLLAKRVDEQLVRKLTGHRSKELCRYQHLMPRLKERTVEEVANELLKESE